MAHITKFKMHSMGQMFAHINRERDQISKYGNADIDPSKTSQNSVLFAGDMEKLQKRLAEVSHTHRKDLVVCCGVVVTLPEELKDKNAFLQQDFFKCCHAFLEKRFGKENAVYSVVHMDETTPHLHFGFVPVVEQERKYRSKAKAGQTYRQERICVHGVLTKQMLMRFHDELQAHVSHYFPDVRIVSDKAHRMKKSKSIAELKEASIRHMEQKESQIDQVCFEAKTWKGVAECWRDEAKLVKEKAEQEAKKIAEEIRQKARQRGREEAEQIKKNAKPELYDEFKADIQALEAENARLLAETHRLNNLLNIAKKALSKLLKHTKSLISHASSQATTDIAETFKECDAHRLLSDEPKQEAQEQKPKAKARVWDEVKKQSRGISR